MPGIWLQVTLPVEMEMTAWWGRVNREATSECLSRGRLSEKVRWGDLPGGTCGMSNEKSRGSVSLAMGQTNAKAPCEGGLGSFLWQRRDLWFWHTVMGREGVKLGRQAASYTVEMVLIFFPKATWSYSVEMYEWHRDLFGCWVGNGLDVGKDREKEGDQAIECRKWDIAVLWSEAVVLEMERGRHI